MGEKIATRHSKERRKGKTDWARVLVVSEKELERSITSDPDSDVAGLDWTQARFLDTGTFLYGCAPAALMQC
jgi:hypothetical protein